tara:strand:- start:413 stop:1051 length:639 start_codon:yes stop_codon:yes gene_type:complete
MRKGIATFLLLLSFPLALPASGTEIGSMWESTNLFHNHPITNKTCSEVPANKLHRVPGYEFTYQKTDDCDFFFPSQTSLALHVFYIEWTNKFRDDDRILLRALNNLEVEYGTYQRLVSRIFSIDGKFYPHPHPVKGLTSNKGKYIFVWIGKGTHPKLYKTSLVHELVHVAIYASNFGAHGDPDHEGPKYKGWTHSHTKFITDTNTILEDMDL